MDTCNKIAGICKGWLRMLSYRSKTIDNDLTETDRPCYGSAARYVAAQWKDY